MQGVEGVFASTTSFSNMIWSDAEIQLDIDKLTKANVLLSRRNLGSFTSAYISIRVKSKSRDRNITLYPHGQLALIWDYSNVARSPAKSVAHEDF